MATAAYKTVDGSHWLP